MEGERQHSPDSCPAPTTGPLLTAAGTGLGDPADSLQLLDPHGPGLHGCPRPPLTLNRGASRRQTSPCSSVSPSLCTGHEKRAETCTAVPALQSRTRQTAASASSRQIARTCKPVPKSYAKPVSRFHPKHIKFLLHKHMLGSAEAPRCRGTRGNLLRTEAQSMADGVSHSCFFQGKTRQVSGCIFYMLQSKQKR